MQPTTSWFDSVHLETMPPRSSFTSPSIVLCPRCSLRLRKRSETRSYHARVPDRSFISFDGIDVVPFLQGLVTANITKSAQKPVTQGQKSLTQALYTAFLNAQGRILNDVLLYPNTLEGGDYENKFLVEVDSRSAPSLLKHLKKHKLRSKFKMRLLEPEELETWSHWPKSDSKETDLQMDTSSPSICAEDPRPGLRDRLIIPSGSSISKQLQDQALDSREYTAYRMSHGVAEGQQEIISESALPQESNIDFFNGIDFRKGCYLGQELTIRTHHTGVVRKRIIPVKLSDIDIDNQEPSSGGLELGSIDWDYPQPPQHSNISKMDSSKGRSAGKWLSGVGNIGLALCRLEMVSDIQLTDSTTTFDPEQKFKVSWEDGNEMIKEARVEPIIPEWMRERLRRSQDGEEEDVN